MNSFIRANILNKISAVKYGDSNTLGGKYEKAFRMGVDCAYKSVEEYLKSDEVTKAPSELSEMVRWYGGCSVDNENYYEVLRTQYNTLGGTLNVNAGVLHELCRRLEVLEERIAKGEEG